MNGNIHVFLKYSDQIKFTEVKTHYRTCTNKHLLAFKPTSAYLYKMAIFFRLVVVLPTEKASNH